MKPKRGAKAQVEAELTSFLNERDGLARDPMSRQPNSLSVESLINDK